MSQQRAYRKKYSFRPWAVPLLLVSLILFVIGAVGAADLLIRGQKEAQAFDELTQLLGTTSFAEGGEETPLSDGVGQAEEEPQVIQASVSSDQMQQLSILPIAPKQMLARYAELYARNADMVGWLTVPGTKVNYPVVSTPEDPHYYLHLDFDKKKSQSGTPFYGGGCTDDSSCLIIYAHNMKNDTMFGSLDWYEKKSFWEKNKVVKYDTLYEEREYEIISVFKGRVLYQNEEGFRYYRYGGDLNEAMFTELMQGIQDRELYATGQTATFGDQLLLLSTCSNYGENDRLVVVAKRVNQ